MISPVRRDPHVSIPSRLKLGTKSSRLYLAEIEARDVAHTLVDRSNADNTYGGAARAAMLNMTVSLSRAVAPTRVTRGAPVW